MRGWLIDVYADYDQDCIVSWLKTDSGVKRIVDRQYFPNFYVHGEMEKLKEIEDWLSSLPLKDMHFDQQKIRLGSDELFDVLNITPFKYADMRFLAGEIDSRGNYRDFDFYNVDIRLSQRYTLEKGIFPMAYIDFTHEFVLLDNQWAIHYRLPPLKSIEIGIKLQSNNGIKRLSDPLEKIKIDDSILQSDNEKETLLALAHEINSIDPDVIYIRDGDSFVLPYLYKRAAFHDVLDEFQLGRERQHNRPEQRKGKSYFSYGRIKYRPPRYTIKGRIHIDNGNSFLHMESGIYGLIELSRISNIPPQQLAKLSPGTAVSAMQVNQAMRDGHPVKWKKNLPEDFKTAKKLMVCDRGGFIFEPKVGIHNDVLELDFTSLYPSIMVRYNISPETIKCDCCPKSKLIVPELGYNICERKDGLIRKVLQPVIRRRIIYKKMVRRRKEAMYKERADILKWLLVCSFGYTGYKNARFGRIECHESITAYARDILLRSSEIASMHGYEVLHGIIDSLWLKGDSDPQKLAEHIGGHIGIPIEIKGVYKWIVFLPCKSIDVGAMNRYYGVFEDGRMKIRGIEARRNDTCPLVKNAQLEILDLLATANNAEEFKRLLPSALSILRKWAERVRNSDVNLEDLILTTRVSRRLEDYRQLNNQVAALTQLREANVDVHPGEVVQYVLLDSESKNPLKRLKIAELLEGNERYDKGKYVEFLFKAGETLFQPFGYDVRRIAMVANEEKSEKASREIGSGQSSPAISP